MAMLDGVKELSLARLNEITQAWVELEYHQNKHSEIGMTPLCRYTDAKDTGRPCPDSVTLRQAFRCTVRRRQRRSDGTLSLSGKRFEIPDRYRHIETPCVRYARWDLRSVDLIDPHTKQILCPLYPLDKSANASGQRRVRVRHASDKTNVTDTTPTVPTGSELPPLLRKLMAEYAATGKPPAYLVKTTLESEHE